MGAQSLAKMGARLKILIVDDHPLIRDSMRACLPQLGHDIAVLEARTGVEALELARDHPDLDLLLLDLGLPGTDGLATLTEFRTRYPAIPVVVLSAVEDPETMRETLRRGAMGFVPKSAAVQVMLSALRLVLSGGVYVPPQLLDAGPSSRSPHPPHVSNRSPQTTRPRTPADIGLTERQAQVLALMIHGKPNKIIARELGISEMTVKAHVTAILRILDVSNRTEAVVAVNALGLRLDEPRAPKATDGGRND